MSLESVKNTLKPLVGKTIKELVVHTSMNQIDLDSLLIRFTDGSELCLNPQSRRIEVKLFDKEAEWKVGAVPVHSEFVCVNSKEDLQKYVENESGNKIDGLGTVEIYGRKDKIIEITHNINKLDGLQMVLTVQNGNINYTLTLSEDKVEQAVSDLYKGNLNIKYEDTIEGG